MSKILSNVKDSIKNFLKDLMKDKRKTFVIFALIAFITALAGMILQTQTAPVVYSNHSFEAVSIITTILVGIAILMHLKNNKYVYPLFILALVLSAIVIHNIYNPSNSALVSPDVLFGLAIAVLVMFIIPGYFVKVDYKPYTNLMKKAAV